MRQVSDSHLPEALSFEAVSQGAAARSRRWRQRQRRHYLSRWNGPDRLPWGSLWILCRGFLKKSLAYDGDGEEHEERTGGEALEHFQFFRGSYASDASH